jgi:small subunit ribosomal protein S16
VGAKKRPSYRIVATESSSPRDGRFIEQVGFYDPLTEPSTITLNEERVKYWLSVGAQPSDTVRGLLRKQGVIADAAPAAATAATPTPAA